MRKPLGTWWARCRLVSVLSLSSDVAEPSPCCPSSCWSEVVVLVDFGRALCGGVGFIGFWGFVPSPRHSFKAAQAIGKVGL